MTALITKHKKLSLLPLLLAAAAVLLYVRAHSPAPAPVRSEKMLLISSGSVSGTLDDILKQRGFILDHTTGAHYIFYNTARDRHVTVPYHAKDLPKGTLLAILDQAGLDRKDIT